VPFNLDRLAVAGAPVPILNGVPTDPESGFAYSFSSNGSLAYVSGATASAEHTLTWVDRKGKERAIAASKQLYEDLSLSPDGRQAAFTIEGPTWNVWICHLERGTLTRLTFEEDCRDPLWSPDGKRIVYTSFRKGRYGLYWKAADGTGEEDLVTSSEHILWALSWSSDGNSLVHGDLNPGTGYDIVSLPIKGDRKPRLILHTSFESLAAVSPDGHWLAHSSNESGREEVYVQPFPNPGGKWQISNDGGTRPSWSRNGSELFYRSGEQLLVVSVQTKPSFSASTPRLLFERAYWHSGRDYDPAPDDRRFLFIKESEHAATPIQINVVLNWFDELKRTLQSAKNP
jgi:serine/threonine-protein kinase